MLTVCCGRWDKSLTEATTQAEDERFASQTDQGTDLRLVPAEERRRLRKQAQGLLSGKTKWTPSWTDFRRDGRPLAGI